MTITQNRTSGFQSTLGIILAAGGRWAWLWWAPIVIWLLVAGANRLTLRTPEPGDIVYSDAALSWFAITMVLQLLLLWAWRSRMLVSFGYSRGRVYLTLGALTVLSWAVHLVLITVADGLEWRYVGESGPRVFATGTEQFWLWFALLYGAPLVGVLFFAVVMATRFGLGGLVVGLGGGLLGAVVAMWLWAGLYMFIDQLVSGMLLVGILCAGLYALGWAAFRTQPV